MVLGEYANDQLIVICFSSSLFWFLATAMQFVLYTCEGVYIFHSYLIYSKYELQQYAILLSEFILSNVVVVIRFVPNWEMSMLQSNLPHTKLK